MIFLLDKVLDFKFIIGSNITGDIKCISSAILAKCFIEFNNAAADASKSSEPFPVIIVPSFNSICYYWANIIIFFL